VAVLFLSTIMQKKAQDSNLIYKSTKESFLKRLDGYFLKASGVQKVIFSGVSMKFFKNDFSFFSMTSYRPFRRGQSFKNEQYIKFRPITLLRSKIPVFTNF